MIGRDDSPQDSHALPRSAQRALSAHASAVAHALPGTRTARRRLALEILSDLVDATELRTTRGWSAPDAVAQAIAEFGDVGLTQAALAPLLARAAIRRRAAVTASIACAIGLWWLAIFPFGGTEPWAENSEPLIPSLSDGLASSGLVMALAATTVCAVVVFLQRRFDPDATVMWLRAAYLLVVLATASALLGISAYTAALGEASPRAIYLPSLAVALISGALLVCGVARRGREVSHRAVAR